MANSIGFESTGLELLKSSHESHLDWTITLHAGNRYLRIKPEALPRYEFYGECWPYIDPRHTDLRKVSESINFEKLQLKVNDFLVLEMNEEVEVPVNHIGMVYHLWDGCIHSSATLVYPGWYGRLALEFCVLKLTTVKPGALLAALSVQKPVNQLAVYDGPYQNQSDPYPR